MSTIIFIQTWVYHVWSGLYRWLKRLFGEQRTGVAPAKTLDELNQRLLRANWKADSWRELGDAIADPRHFQYLLDTEEAPTPGDCDEFATYAHAVLTLAPPVGVKPIGILTVLWWNPWFWGLKKPGGHHVCLFQQDGKFGHIGNWGVFAGFPTFRHAVAHVAESRDLVGWVLWRELCNVLAYDSSLPDVASTLGSFK
jgi:hypothetical protein